MKKIISHSCHQVHSGSVFLLFDPVGTKATHNDKLCFWVTWAILIHCINSRINPSLAPTPDQSVHHSYPSLKNTPFLHWLHWSFHFDNFLCSHCWKCHQNDTVHAEPDHHINVNWSTLRPHKAISIQTYVKLKSSSYEARIIPAKLGQYNNDWCPGCLRHQVIRSHSNDYTKTLYKRY